MRTPDSARRAPAALAAALLSAALAAACDAPAVAPGLDQYFYPDGGPCLAGAPDCAVPQPAGVISGEVVYSGPRRGDVILLLFAASSLPPPDGTATTAVALSRVPAAKLFGSSGGIGPFSAPYFFSQVKPGDYQIRAFLDITGDFDPFADFTQSPRAGAPTGGSVVFVGGVPQLASFTVPSNQVARVNVALGQEAAFDPPAFRVADGSPLGLAADFDRPQPIVLQALNPGVPRATFAAPKFAVELRRGSDGLPHFSDRDGLVDVYPQVLLRQLKDASGKAVASSAAAIIPAKVQPSAVLPLLYASVPGQAPLGLDRITVLVQPLAVKLTATGQPEPLAAIPPGEYQIVVIEKSGQVWTLPNQLGDPAAVDSRYFSASQAQTITLRPPLSPSGSISGRVKYPAGRVPGNLVLQAFRGGAALAPPLAAQPPIRVKLVPGAFITLDSGGTIPYTLDGLPAGKYVVEALDDGDGNFNSLDLLQTPTKGDLIGGVLDANGHLAEIDVSGPITGKDVTLVAAPGQDPQGNGVALDPPAFELDPAGGAAQIAQDARGTVRFGVRAKPIAFPMGAGSAQTTFFTVGLVRDAAGKPVDSDSDGLPDVWPRALLVLLDPADPTNLTQATPTTVIPAAVDPTPFLPALLSGSADLVLPATSLSLIVRPAALDASDPSAPKRLPAMPAGRYKLVLMNKTGQLWQIPNEAGPAALDPRVAQCATGCAPGQVNTAAQGGFFSVRPPTAPVPAGEIDGTLTIAGSPTVASVAVFAFGVADPPPPLGTGKPVSADLHLGAELVPGTGVKTVAYALRGLAAGDYYVTALVDTRGDLALDPQLWAAAPGPGALAGGHVDAQGHLAKVTVGSAAVAGVAAVASAASPLPVRPSFAVSQGGVPVASDLTTLFPDALTPQRITLRAGGKVDAQASWRQVLDASTAALAPESGTPQLTVAFRGCSASAPSQGVDADFDGLPDLWPRVLVVRLADSDPSGLAQDPVTTVIPAAVDPLRFLPALGACSDGKSVPASEVDVVLSPIAVQPQRDGTIRQLPIPPGRYGLVLVAASGQVWRIPNELQPALLDPRAAATPAGQALAPQGVAIRVAAQVPAPLGGSISGQVKLQGYGAADAGNLIVAAYAAANPPPPLGLGRPVAVQVFPRPLVALAAGASLPYQLANLPPSPAGGYLVAALLDPLGQLSTSFGFMSTPPRGGQLAFYTGGGASPAPLVVGSGAVTGADVTLDKIATAAIPFDRPAFKVDATASQLSVSASAAPGTAAVLRLLPVVPDGLPYPAPATPEFHPVPARNSSGLPYQDASSAGCGGTANKPWVSTQVYASPIDTGQRYVALVKVDQCQFCLALTGKADCSAPPTAITPFDGPLVAAVSNVAIDPLTKGPAGVPLPAGHYAITVVEQDGLLWTLPNDLRTVGGTSGADQGFTFTVTP